MRRLLKPSQNDSDLCALPDSHAPYLYTLSLHDALPICGGGAERLPHLVGRGRALEIILGANDFDGKTAERYGYVNRALPDAELDGFVDALARRIASFDRRAIAAAKNLVNQVSLPSADRLLDAITSFETALTWPEAQQRIQNLLQRGLQQDSDFETHWPAVLGTPL